mgnify:CR=1 FL=1
MKTELSALELYCLTKELQSLEGSKVDKVYQPKKNELLFQLHKAGEGKQVLDICLPGVIFKTSKKHEVTETPPHFCVFLRKKLGNARVQSIEQHEFERILVVNLTTKNETYHLIVELFDKGNVILCNSEYNVLMAVYYKKWKERTVRPNIRYEFPTPLANPIKLTEEQFVEMFYSVEMSLVKFLAIKAGLGGTFSEEVVSVTGIDKSSSKLDEESLKRVYKAMKDLLEREINAVVVYHNEHIESALPFLIQAIKQSSYEHVGEFNKAVEMKQWQEINARQETQKNSNYEKKLHKLQEMVNKQENMKEGFEKTIEENSYKGELIYQNYQTVSKILEQLKKARETMSWQEIKAKLKEHPIIKKVDEKNNQIVLELEEQK